MATALLNTNGRPTPLTVSIKRIGDGLERFISLQDSVINFFEAKAGLQNYRSVITDSAGVSSEMDFTLNCLSVSGLEFTTIPRIQKASSGPNWLLGLTVNISGTYLLKITNTATGIIRHNANFTFTSGVTEMIELFDAGNYTIELSDLFAKASSEDFQGKPSWLNKLAITNDVTSRAVTLYLGATLDCSLQIESEDGSPVSGITHDGSVWSNTGTLAGTSEWASNPWTELFRLNTAVSGVGGLIPGNSYKIKIFPVSNPSSIFRKTITIPLTSRPFPPLEYNLGDSDLTLVPSWIQGAAYTYDAVTNAFILQIASASDLMGKIERVDGQSISGKDQDNNSWSDLLFNTGSNTLVSAPYTERFVFNAMSGAQGIMPNTEHLIRIKRVSDPTNIFALKFTTPPVSTTSLTVIPLSVQNQNCALPPSLSVINSNTNAQIKATVNPGSATTLLWAIIKDGTAVKSGTIPAATSLTINFSAISSGNYTLQIRGGNCISAISQQSFSVASTGSGNEGDGIDCAIGGRKPTIAKIQDATKYGLTYQFDGENVTQILRRVLGGTTIEEIDIPVAGAWGYIHITYPEQAPGNYFLQIQGKNCKSDISELAFTIPADPGTDPDPDPPITGEYQYALLASALPVNLSGTLVKTTGGWLFTATQHYTQQPGYEVTWIITNKKVKSPTLTNYFIGGNPAGISISMAIGRVGIPGLWVTQKDGGGINDGSGSPTIQAFPENVIWTWLHYVLILR